jgi:hypothetical protein
MRLSRADLTAPGGADDNEFVKRQESLFIGRGPAVTLTLSVLLCIGAMTDGAAAAAVVAESLGRHGTTASERESVASLLSSLNDAARKICRHHTGQQATVTAGSMTGLYIGEGLQAIGLYESSARCDSREPMLVHLLNLPPPVALF